MSARHRRRDHADLDFLQILTERIDEVLSDPATIAAQPKRLDFIVQRDPIRKITRSPGRVEIEFQTSEIRLIAFY
jgi:hypothetical protein